MASCDGWSIIESPFRFETFKAYEGLFTLGSGYLHVRGSLEEHFSDAPQNVTYARRPANVTSETFRDTKSQWGTYVPGIFGRHPLLNNQMINLPWFLGLVPVIDGERLDMERCRIEDYRRELRLDTATLTRDLVWHTQSGRCVSLKFDRFISAARPALCMQRMWLQADADVDLVVHAGIDADVRTNGHDHFTEIKPSHPGPFDVECVVRTDAGDTVAVSSVLGTPGGHTPKYKAEPRFAELVTRLRVSAGHPFTMEKRTTVLTSRDRESLESSSAFLAAMDLPFETLHAEHAEEWRRRWAACDVVVEGDPESQLALRASLYHLLRAHVPNDPRVAIDAKGYSGEAYWGRYFWDTEMYLLPFFLYTDPSKARTLADFRIQSLAGARANAARYGYAGARYAWESDAGGHECCPNWQYADHEVHVTADVVYGLAHYAKATNQPAFLTRDAREAILETALFWMQRLDQRHGDDHLSLLGVMGPDEYTPISHNNSYTNRMVSFALKIAADVDRALGAATEEIAAFESAAASLPIIRGSDPMLVLQCEDFDRLAEPRFDELWRDRSRTFASQVSQERLYRSKCLKQADVLMLMMLFPDEFSEEQVRRAWDYYLPLTTHDSSLSAGAHAIVAARLGYTRQAWDFWRMGRAIDLDIEHGGAAEGIHIANAGAVWQMAVFGFAGMRTALQAEVFTLRPCLPEAWTRLAFPIVWKGSPLFVDITPQAVTVENRGRTPVEALIAGQPTTLQPGTRERVMV